MVHASVGATTHPLGAGDVRTAIGDLSLSGLRDVVVEMGYPAYRGDQVGAWLYRSSVRAFDDMTNLPIALRHALGSRFRIDAMEVVVEAVAADDETRKVALRLHDGDVVETVLMRYPTRDDGTGAERATVCVSTQVGCPVKCSFCATGLMGFTRNLSTAEIVEQVLEGARALQRGEIAGGPGRVNNLVFMGMGEPMANYKSVIGAIRRLTEPAPAGLGMSARGITVSTVGLVPRMRDLAEEKIPVTLAVSLHAPDDELREIGRAHV